MKLTKRQRSSSRRNVITLTMSAALTASVISPNATLKPRTASGSARTTDSPNSLSVSSIPGPGTPSALDRSDTADLLLQEHHAVEQRLGGRRATRHVDVDRD